MKTRTTFAALAVAAILGTVGCGKEIPAHIEGEPVKQIRLANNDNLSSLLQQCGIGGRRGVTAASRGTVDYRAFMGALQELNPEQFSNELYPLPGPYIVPTRLCPGPRNEFDYE